MKKGTGSLIGAGPFHIPARGLIDPDASKKLAIGGGFVLTRGA